MGADSSVVTTSTVLADGGVVIFMELGCPPCSVMSINWSEALSSWKNAPSVIGISAAPLDRIARYRDYLGVGFPIYCDTGMVFETAYRVSDFPFRLVIDSAGIIRSETYDSHEIIDTTVLAAQLRGDTILTATTP